MLLCASIAITSVSLANNNADEMERNTESTVFTVLDDEGQFLGPVTLCDKDGNTCSTNYSAYRSYTEKDTNGNGRIYVSSNGLNRFYADPITNNPNFNYRVWIDGKWYYFYI